MEQAQPQYDPRLVRQQVAQGSAKPLPLIDSVINRLASVQDRLSMITGATREYVDLLRGPEPPLPAQPDPARPPGQIPRGDELQWKVEMLERQIELLQHQVSRLGGI